MLRIFMLAAAAVLGFTGTVSAQYAWKPDKPITIVVPWAAGGSTDQVVRVTAAEIEKALGQKVVVINQPGASGSIGTKNVLEAPKDGYTWASGAAKDIGTYIVSGLLNTKVADWRLYLVVANVSVLGVNPNSPYKTAADLVAAMKAKPGQVTVATAGINSSGHAAIETFTRALKLTYKHVTYDGGNPAVNATVAGETEVTTQLAVEQANMLRAKRLRALAVLSDQPLVLEGFGTIPPVTSQVSGFKPDTNYFGIFVPKNSPPEVIATLDKIWADVISKSATIRLMPKEQRRLRAVGRRCRTQAAMPAIQAYGGCCTTASRRSRPTPSAFTLLTRR
jgi:tripartite-type tricarboxylate transporter receptor subunit TctC